MIHHSPISRIAILGLLLGLAVGCDMLGLSKNSPTALGGPPAPGSTIVYDAIGASDADGVGSSVVWLLFVDCPNGTGYPQVATRQLKALNDTGDAFIASEIVRAVTSSAYPAPQSDCGFMSIVPNP